MIEPNFILFILNEIDEEEERYALRINRRNLRDVGNPLTLPEEVFRGIYRLSRECVAELVEEISPHLNNIQREEVAIPKFHKVLATLHVLAQGSYQKCVGQDFLVPMAQQTLSKCIREVTSTIVNHLGHVIKFPTTEVDQARIKEDFFEKGGFPGIIGAVDCTHIAIQAPPYDDPEMPGILFLNRKGFYSMNTQIIVDSDLNILAVNARFPGSVHDSAIWTTSAVKRYLEQSYVNGNTDSWLIGDSGYPLQPFLITPIGGGNLNESERNFNLAHISARNVIERLNGVLKSRFRCCLRHRTLHYKPNVAVNIIYTCCILHNICMNRGDNQIDIEDNDEEEYYVPQIPDDNAIVGRNWLNEGRLTRQRIVNNFY